MKVAEPQILARVQSELLKPQALAYISKAVEREARKAVAAPHDGANAIQRQLDQERRKLQNLVAAIEGGAGAPSTVLKAIADREGSIRKLEGELRQAATKSATPKLPDVPSWVEKQLHELTAVLKTNAARTKSEFRRLNLQLTFEPIEAEPRAHYIVKGQCDLSALVFFYLRSRFQGAVLDPMRVHQAP